VVIDYHIGLTCTGEDAGLSVLGAYDKRREEMNEDTLVIRTDNGPQFISKAFETRCMDLGLEHEFIPVRTPNKNAHIESWHSILERECMRRFEFSSFTEAYLIVVDFIDHYNKNRIHGSLGYRTPVEYHEDCLRNNAKPQLIKL
jgi:putative transposase